MQDDYQFLTTTETMVNEIIVREIMSQVDDPEANDAGDDGDFPDVFENEDDEQTIGGELETLGRFTFFFIYVTNELKVDKSKYNLIQPG